MNRAAMLHEIRSMERTIGFLVGVAGAAALFGVLALIVVVG